MKVRLSRHTLTQFLPNHEAVRAFEKLFEIVNSDIPLEQLEALIQQAISAANAAQFTADAAVALAVQAQEDVDALGLVLDFVEQAPIGGVVRIPDYLEPVPQVQVMVDDLSPVI